MSQQPRLAALLIVIAAAFIAATTLCAKLLGTDALGPALPPFQVSFGRFLFALTLFVSAAMLMRPRFGRVHVRLHLLRTSAGVIGVTCMFAAAARIPLADATAISFLNPVFCMVFAIFLLGERPGKWRWFAAATALCGALVLLRPGAGVVQPAALIALGAALALGFETIWIKRLAGREAPLQVLLVNNAIGLTLTAALALPFWQAPTAAQWLAMAALGGAMAAAQTCFINALARAEASFVTPFSYLTLVFAALYDGVHFGVWPDRVSYAGAALILIGAVLLAWRESRAQARSRHGLRAKRSFQVGR